MDLRALGGTDLEVSPIVFGGNVFGWTVDQDTGFGLLDALADHGINAIDTADAYSSWVSGHKGGESETIIGQWLHKSRRRDEVVIATKVGLLPDRPGLSRANIIGAAEDSLRRLQVDHIDLYYSHRDVAATELEETLGAYQTLIDQGKVRAIGASNHTGDRLREAASVAKSVGVTAYQVIQDEYNLYDRTRYERDLEPVVADLGLGVVAYRPLASGFLSGKYRSEGDLSKSPRGVRGVARYLDPRGMRIIAELTEVAAKYSVAPASVAIAWELTRAGVTAVTASATSLEQLASLGAALQVRLTEEDMRRLNQASTY